MEPPRRLSDWPWVEVRVDCKLCTRCGHYRLARLAARYGAEFGMDQLLADLARDCPWYRTNPRKNEPRCGIRFTDIEREPGALARRPASERNVPGPILRQSRLSDLVQPAVAIACAPCGRRGVYNVARLIERHGDIVLPDLLPIVAVSCPQRREATPRCQAVFEAPRRP